MTARLLATKFTIPPAVPGRLNRPRLLDRLERGLLPGCSLVLACAPAGYGKTTLLSEWAGAQGPGGARFAWLSLEAADNDLARFFAYLSAALEKAIPAARVMIDDLLAAPSPPAPTDLSAGLIGALADFPGSLVIVLDDYQVIHENAIHAALVFLVEHLPANVHLALATRSDPPLPLHRLRAQGRMVEVRLNDLRFDQSETGQLIDRAAETQLNEPEIALLAKITEGWAAGLRMALLSMRGKERPGDFLQGLSGRNRFILDYLAEEALHNQSQDVQEFLLKTAVLERLCAPLCDRLTGQSNGQEMLEALEAANCFLIPLDEERTWYRYHHLFADLLQVRLKQRARSQPGLIKALHHQAAAWLEDQQASEEAVRHSLQAGDYERAARIVERSTFELLSRGQLHQLLAWIHLLPDELAARRPWLDICQAWTLAFAARLPETEARLARAEASLAAGSYSPAEQARMWFEIHAIRSLAAITSGSLPAALALVEQQDKTPQDEIVPAEASFARSVQRWAVGYALRIKGDLPGAEACFSETLQIAYALDNLYSIVSAAVDLGMVLRQQGDLRRAEEIYRAGLARAAPAASTPGFVGRLEAFLAALRIEQSDLEEAARLVDQAIEHNRSWENPNHCAYTWTVKARLELLQNRPGLAAAALAEAGAWIARGPVVPNLMATVTLVQVRLWLHSGALEQAKAWLSQQALPPPAANTLLSEGDEALRLASARVLLATGQAAAACVQLELVEAAARRGNRLAALIEALVLRACAAPGPDEASAILREALTLGLSRGFRQVFLEDGRRLIPALERCQEITGVSELLAALRESETRHPAESPLTAREVEILRWVASGLTNPEIGARLYIAPGTIKAHTAAIYRKLDVANRAEAIAKAKDLGLL